MRLILVRHAIAVPRGTAGLEDGERPLTSRGERRFRLAAAGLARLTPSPDVLLSSPLKRAWQTALIASETWGGPAPLETPALAGGRFDEIEEALAEFPDAACAALVGHEPHMSRLLARLLGNGRGESLGFKKGGAALLDLAGSLSDGGSLVWFLPPRVLRALAGA